MRKILTAMSLVLLSACGLNSVPIAEEEAKARWADVENQYQRRADLIPNLVSVVKAAGGQEKDILVQISEARSKAGQVTVGQDELGDPAKMAAFERAQNTLTLSVYRLAEAYPDLKSQQNYTILMAQLEGAENRIGIARMDYNKAVQAYNSRIRTFPDSIGAKMFHDAKPLVPFKATASDASTAPKTGL